MEDIQLINEKVKSRISDGILTKKGVATFLDISRPTLDVRLIDCKYSHEQFLKLKELI